MHSNSPAECSRNIHVINIPESESKVELLNHERDMNIGILTEVAERIIEDQENSEGVCKASNIVYNTRGWDVDC